MSLPLEYPLISCSALSRRLASKGDETVLVYISDDPSAVGIPGSLLVPIAALRDADILLQHIGGDPEPDEALVIVCYEEVGLSTAAVAWWLLVSRGWRFVSVLEGGLATWRAKADPRLGSQSPEALSPTRKRRSTLICPDVKLHTAVRQKVTTDACADGKEISIDPALLLLQGCDLAEPKLLKWILLEAGVVFEEDHETVVFGAKAHLLLLILCSLGKRNISLGVEVHVDLQLATDEDASTEPQRKVSSLTTPDRSVRASVAEDNMTISMPLINNSRQSMVPPIRKRSTSSRHGSLSCKSCSVF